LESLLFLCSSDKRKCNDINNLAVKSDRLLEGLVSAHTKRAGASATEAAETAGRTSALSFGGAWPSLCGWRAAGKRWMCGTAPIAAKINQTVRKLDGVDGRDD
jgi:hypothetical protein